MSTPSTRVLIVDDNERTRDQLIELLRFDDIEVVGESTFGAAAFTWAQELNVDVVIVTIEEPVARSLRTVEALSAGSQTWPVVGVSTNGDRETMRKAMVSGVRDFLVMPVAAAELRATIVNVHQVDRARRSGKDHVESTRHLGTVIAVAGFKGGIGKSTVSSSIAVALAQHTQQHVALLDLDLQFGDAAVMLDLVPTATIEHVAREVSRLDPQLIQGSLATHASRLKLLAAPQTPEAAEEIDNDTAARILEMLAATNDFVVVDTAPHLDGLAAAAMDLSTIVLVLVVPEIPCLRRTKAALALMQSWGYSRDKVKLVVNRANVRGGVTIPEIQRVLDYPIFAEIPDDRAVAKGISIGTPVAMSAPNSKAGRAVNSLARMLAGVPSPEPRRGFMRRQPKTQSENGPTASWAPAPDAGQPGWWGPPTPQNAGPGAPPLARSAEIGAPRNAWEVQWPTSVAESVPSNGYTAPTPSHWAPSDGENGHRAGVSFHEIVHAGRRPESSVSVWFRRSTGKE